MIDGQVKKGSRHHFLIDVLEILENLEKIIVVVWGEVSELNQKLPGL